MAEEPNSRQLNETYSLENLLLEKENKKYSFLLWCKSPYSLSVCLRWVMNSTDFFHLEYWGLQKLLFD